MRIEGSNGQAYRITRSIFVTFQQEGIHKYPGADTDPKLATGGWDDVSFLGVPHRHIFHYRVEIAVTHNERDIEFIQFKRWILRQYGEGVDTLDFNGKSCETLAEELGNKIREKYPNRDLIVTVSEDGENGSTLSWTQL
jgi:hypothetical protein